MHQGGRRCGGSLATINTAEGCVSCVMSCVPLVCTQNGRGEGARHPLSLIRPSLDSSRLSFQLLHLALDPLGL